MHRRFVQRKLHRFRCTGNAVHTNAIGRHCWKRSLARVQGRVKRFLIKNKRRLRRTKGVRQVIQLNKRCDINSERELAKTKLKNVLSSNQIIDHQTSKRKRRNRMPSTRVTHNYFAPNRMHHYTRPT